MLDMAGYTNKVLDRTYAALENERVDRAVGPAEEVGIPVESDHFYGVLHGGRIRYAHRFSATARGRDAAIAAAAEIRKRPGVDGATLESGFFKDFCGAVAVEVLSVFGVDADFGDFAVLAGDKMSLHSKSAAEAIQAAWRVTRTLPSDLYSARAYAIRAL